MKLSHFLVFTTKKWFLPNWCLVVVEKTTIKAIEAKNWGKKNLTLTLN
jgi:hypothetical protein